MSFADARQQIAALVKEKNCGPILVRLSWHDAGTYSAADHTGGAHAAMQHPGGEAAYGANAGLHIARDLLAVIKAKFPQISHADFWALAAVVAIEEMGGPKITFRPGRVDAKSAAESAPDGRLPNPTLKADHLRDVFYRMGLTDRDIVALSGAHTVGKGHKGRSGFEGPWTHNHLKFDNDFFVELTKPAGYWTQKEGPIPQFEDPSKKLMMCPSDLALIEDPKLKVFVDLYAKDQNAFFADFAAAFQKLQELGWEGKLGSPQ